tara:strand:+ start:1432 stop:2259 length:828 start_codon:yes stop_codon:yes gene_type:complete
MYYPKTQIIEDQYANPGEFVISQTREPYSGPYFKTSTNSYFTGKNYQDLPNYALEQLSISPGLTQSEIEAETKPDSYYIIDDEYYAAKQYNINRPSPRGPKSSIPNPTPKDYKIGEFQRYFLRKPNGNQIIEVDKNEYFLFGGKDESVQWQQYQVISQSWVLTGKSSKEVGTINFNVATLIEFQNKAYGYIPYFKGKFNQYYKNAEGENLKTDGSEFVNQKTGEKYVGLYHIHPSKGPMVGAKHVNTSHDYLVPINEFQPQLLNPTGSVEYSGGY